MNNTCRFCKIMFKTDDKHVCPDCISEIKKNLADLDFRNELLAILGQDPKIKFEFLETILEDDKVLKLIAKHVINVDLKDIGLGGLGSLADFFRKHGQI